MTNQLATFTSTFDFLKRFALIFRGPMFVTAFRKIDPVFREKLLITVSMTNNCAG